VQTSCLSQSHLGCIDQRLYKAKAREEVSMGKMLQIKLDMRERKLSLQKWSLMVASAIRRDDRKALRELVLYGLNMSYVEASRLSDRMVEELLDRNADKS
jgi:hypothetical protein